MTTQEFVEKYNIGITFEEMYVLQHKANRMKYFTFKDKYLKNNTKSYLDGLKYMFSTYIANRIHPEKIETGSTANLNFVQFIRDYEAAKKDEFEKSNSNRKRKPYEGVEKQALTMIEAQMKYFNTSVSKIWANAIKKGAHLEGFRSIVTDAENQALARNNADESARRKYSPAEKRTNALLCVTYKALHAVINERTWGWRLNPFNWKRWYQENALMDDLAKRLEVLEITTDINPVSNRKTDGLLYAQCKDDVIDEVEIRNFKRYSELGKKAREEIDKINAQEQDLDAFLDADELDNELNLDAPANENDIFNDLDQSVIMNGDHAELDGDGEILNALINEEIEAEKREKNLNEQENLKQQANKEADKLKSQEEKAKEQEVKKEIISENKKRVVRESRATDTIKKPTTRIESRQLFSNKNITNTVIKELAEILAPSDKTNAMSVARKLHQNLQMLTSETWINADKMHDNAKNMFKSVYNIISRDIPKANVGDKLIAAQEITDIMLNVYSPTAANPKLAKYGDNYAIKDFDNEDIEKLTGFKGNVDELMNNVKSNLGIVKEHVHFPNGEFKENEIGKSNKVEYHKAPEKDKVINH